MTSKNPAANTGGRPPFDPTPANRQMVETMAGCGIPENEIALAVGVALKTLRRHFRQELDTGHTKANARVAGNLYRIATGSGREAVTAAIFWLKTRCGWSEPIPPRVYPMGVKERAQQAAHESAKGTSWEKILR